MFRLWGYDEVSPPRVERMDTLMAGGAIASNRTSCGWWPMSPRGCRPEMTASIARAACTRLGLIGQSPLRLWASGTVFRTRSADEGGQCIEENLQSGVELFGVSGSEAEMELLSLLMASVQTLGLPGQPETTAVAGPHRPDGSGAPVHFMGAVRDQIRTALIDFDRLAIESFDLADQAPKIRLLSASGLPRHPRPGAGEAQQSCDEQPVFEELRRLCAHLASAAQAQAVTIQLDPTFQPHFELYTGLVFQLVCDGRRTAPVVIARGGRYDDLVRRCGATEDRAFGAGFSLAIDPIRELISDLDAAEQQQSDVLVAFSTGLESGIRHGASAQLARAGTMLP